MSAYTNKTSHDFRRHFKSKSIKTGTAIPITVILNVQGGISDDTDQRIQEYRINLQAAFTRVKGHLEGIGVHTIESVTQRRAIKIKANKTQLQQLAESPDIARMELVYSG